MSTAPGLAGEWADPLQPIPLHRRRLRLVPPPVPLSPLVGRGGDVIAVSGMLTRRDARLVTLVGPGGIGKTRLALQVAAQCAAAFDGQIAWAPVATATTPGAVAAALAQAVGLAKADAGPTIEALKTALRDARLLLVVDNFEQVLDAAPLLSDLLRACPELALLVTSRAVLRVAGEHPVDVPPLATTPSATMPESAPAVRLFAQQAASVFPAFALTPVTTPVVAEICRRLDGLPLAIELAAARSALLPPAPLLARLDRRLPQLTAGQRDAPARHRTMRDAIAWSYDLLTPDEQALFRCLGVFSGGFTLEAATAVAAEVPDLLAALGALVDNSLVRLESPSDAGADARYTMLETVREFAAERLADRGEAAAVQDAHAEFVIALAERAKPGLETTAAPVWAARLEAEHGNVQAALVWLEASGRWHDLLRLAYAMVNFWGTSLRLREARSWLERALDPSRSSAAAPALRAGAAWGLGWIALCMDDLDTAGARLDEALTIRRQLGDDLGVANTLTLLGRVAEQRGDEEHAEARYAEALDGFRAIGHLQGIAWSLVAQAYAADRRRDFAEAKRLAEEAVAVSRESGNQHQLADALVSLGQAAAARADWTPAVAALREALDLGRDVGNRMTCAVVIAGLAAVAVAVGEPERAARLLGAVTALSEAGGLAGPVLPDLHKRALGAARDALDEPSFAAAYAAGRALTQRQAEAEALAVTIQPATIPAPDSAREVLSPREIEVLRLLATGLSDREIAEALFIGERTVNTHVGRLYTKLGVRNRAAAVTAAVTAGLIDAVPTGTDLS